MYNVSIHAIQSNQTQIPRSRRLFHAPESRPSALPWQLPPIRRSTQSKRAIVGQRAAPTCAPLSIPATNNELLRLPTPDKSIVPDKKSSCGQERPLSCGDGWSKRAWSFPPRVIQSYTVSRYYAPVSITDTVITGLSSSLRARAIEDRAEIARVHLKSYASKRYI
ncbi:hypothetical protein EI94DRAFT_560517 [Lactarius quietus]|nr:hypothetical protein EI94DRAFT_560517 [Lactarius quietus]